MLSLTRKVCFSSVSECRRVQEDRVLCHEGLWQPCPSEAIVHVVKDTSLSTSEVIELRNLAVLIAVWRAPETQHFVDNGADVTGKSSLTWNIPPKGVIFSDFMLTFAMSLKIFLLVLKRSTKVSKNLTWQNPGPLGFAACPSKNFLLLRNL